MAHNFVWKNLHCCQYIRGICHQTLSSVSSAEAKSWQPEIKDEVVVVTVDTMYDNARHGLMSTGN